MAYKSHNKLWENEFDNIVYKKDKNKEMKMNQLKLEVHDNYKKDEKLAIKFQPIDDEDVLNKAYLDEKFFEKRSLIIFRKRLQRI